MAPWASDMSERAQDKSARSLHIALEEDLKILPKAGWKAHTASDSSDRVMRRPRCVIESSSAI